MIERDEDLHKQNRDVLFENEKFVIGVLQAVSGATIVAAISQAKTITDLTSASAFRWIVTFACLALALSLAAAFFKHQYKMWDVKLGSTKGVEMAVIAIRRHKLMSIYLRSMRVCLWSAWITILGALGCVVLSLWWPRALG